MGFSEPPWPVIAFAPRLMLASSLRMLMPRTPNLGATAMRAPSAHSLCTTPRLSYTQRQDLTGRPISPHVFIYRFPMIALSSITVRITGILASAGLSAVGGATLYAGSEWVVDTVHDFGGVSKRLTGFDLAPAAKASVAFVLAYQWLGSARHMIWDLTGWGFTNKMMLQSAYGLFASSAIISLGLAAYSLPPPKETKKEH